MKRRIRRIRRALKRAGLYNAFHITLIAVLLTGFCVILFNVKEPEQQEEKPETTQAEVMQNPETMTRTAESIEDKYKVFDTMSEDWGSDDLEGFVFYDLPEQYADKGYFPEKMQIYTRCLCKQNDVPYALVLAIIEHESGYEFDKTGDNGNSKGYMQIYEKWHTDRMQKLNCTDLMNPYQNVKVGIDFLSYLLKKYGTVQDALAAYNYGERGAREHLWNNGVYVYSYNTAIMQRKGKKDIRIVAAGHGNRFEDIENQLIGEKGKGWRELIAGAIDNAYDRLVASTPPQTEEEKTHCEMIKEAVKGMFINESRTAAEAEFIKTHIVDYEKIFDVCMNGDDLEFKKGLVRLQKMQNEYVMQREREETANE